MSSNSKTIISELQTTLDKIKKKISNRDYLNLSNNLKSLYREEEKNDNGYDLYEITLLFPQVKNSCESCCSCCSSFLTQLKIKARVKLDLDLEDENLVLRGDKLVLNWRPGSQQFYDLFKLMSVVFPQPNVILGNSLDVGGEDEDSLVNVYPKNCMILNMEKV